MAWKPSLATPCRKPALVLLLLMVAGCSGAAGPHTQLRLDFGGSRADVAANVPFDATNRATASLYQAQGGSHPDFYSAFDQLAQWSASSGTAYHASYDKDFGFFLDSIDGVPAAGQHLFWNLQLNGMNSTVGMGLLQVHEGDHVSWTLTPF